MQINNGYPYMREFDFRTPPKKVTAYVKHNGEFKKLKAYKKDDSLVETNIYVLAKGGV